MYKNLITLLTNAPILIFASVDHLRTSMYIYIIYYYKYHVRKEAYKYFCLFPESDWSVDENHSLGNNKGGGRGGGGPPTLRGKLSF